MRPARRTARSRAPGLMVVGMITRKSQSLSSCAVPRARDPKGITCSMGRALRNRATTSSGIGTGYTLPGTRLSMVQRCASRGTSARCGDGGGQRHSAAVPLIPGGTGRVARGFPPAEARLHAVEDDVVQGHVRAEGPTACREPPPPGEEVPAATRTAHDSPRAAPGGRGSRTGSDDWQSRSAGASFPRHLRRDPVTRDRRPPTDGTHPHSVLKPVSNLHGFTPPQGHMPSSLFMGRSASPARFAIRPAGSP